MVVFSSFYKLGITLPFSKTIFLIIFCFYFQLVDFLIFSVISLLLSIMLLVCYSMAVHTVFTGEEVGSFSWYSYNRHPDQNIPRTKIFTTLVLVLGCLEFLLCLGSIGYVVYSYKRDYNRTPVSRICILWFALSDVKIA